MASFTISLGIGSPSAIPEFILFGLSPNPSQNPLTVSAITLQATYDPVVELSARYAPDVPLSASYRPALELPAYFEDGD